MGWWQALLLGVVQGATEYIPVSSSAHLVLVPWLLGWPQPEGNTVFAFDVLVQWGTLVGVFAYFWRDIWQIVHYVLIGIVRGQPLAAPEARLGWAVVLGSLPAVVSGLMFKDAVEAVFGEPRYVAWLLLGTALILLVADRLGRRQRTLQHLGWLDALVIGVWQVAALLPGISRSGATIGGAMLRNFDRTSAARFSFLLSVPALLGAGLLSLGDLIQAGNLGAQLPSLALGFVAAALTGYLCIRWLLSFLVRHSLCVFACYCAVLGAGCLVYGWLA